MSESRHLFVDPSLVDASGHHLGLAREFEARVGSDYFWCALNRRAHLDMGLPKRALLRTFKHTMNEASRARRYGRLATALGLLQSALESRNVWRREPRSNQRPNAAPVALANAARARSLHGAGLRTACAAFRPGPNDHIVFESGDAEQALALAELLEGGRAGAASLHFRLMYDDVARHATDLTWRSALTRLVQALDGQPRVFFSAETQAFARAMEAVVEQSVLVCPHPSVLQPRPAPTARSPFVLFVPGEPRSDKGLKLVSEVVEGLSRTRRNDISIRVQSNLKGDCVTSLDRRLDTPAYAEAWANCHAALLLHDAHVFKLRGSGTVCDAVMSQRPYVCLEGASLTEWTEDGNAIAAPSHPTAIIEAVERLVTHYDSFQGRTAAARDRLLGQLRSREDRLLKAR